MARSVVWLQPSSRRLSRAVDTVINHRSQLSAWYRSGLARCSQIRCMPLAGDQDSPWVFGIECDSRRQRDQLRKHLAENYGVETRNYFPPLHCQPAFQTQPELTRMACPNAMALYEKGFYLPSYFDLRESDVEAISAAIMTFFNIWNPQFGSFVVPGS